MHPGIKSLTWRSLAALTFLFAAANTSLADYAYGSSNESEANKLVVNGATELQTGENLGWWSGTASNNATNINYFVGTLEGAPDVRNNFFIFDIAELSAPVTSVVLQLQVWDVFSSVGASTILYSLFDVTTDVDVLNNNEGTSWAIFNDLGSGNHYGSFEISTSLSSADVVTLILNSAAIADLNAAIEANADAFAIGGTLAFKPVPVENGVPDAANTLVLLLLALVCLWAVRRRKQES